MEPRSTLELDLCWRNAMGQAATASYPKEACGILIGARLEAGWRVIDIVDAPNTSSQDQTRFFDIDPKILFEVYRSVRAAEDGRKVIGFYHSHPLSTAVPSAYDRLQAHEAGKVWVILGGRGALMDQAPSLNVVPSTWDIQAWVSGQAANADFQSVVIR